MKIFFFTLAFLAMQNDKPIKPGVLETKSDVLIFVEPALRVIDSNGALVATDPRGFVIVNTNKNQRIVASYKMIPSNRVVMTDMFGTQDDLVEREYTILLQPGQSIDLLDEIPGGFIKDTNGIPRRQIAATISYQLLGYYIPNPNLKDLDTGLAEDHFRMQPVRDEQYNLQGCKQPNTPNVHVLYNLNPTKRIIAKVNWKSPGNLDGSQNLYIDNLSWTTVTCTMTDLDSFSISTVRYRN